MSKQTQPDDVQMRARALSRWEGEGGALAPTGVTGAIDESELRILARLGAALLDEWAALTPQLQSNVIDRARTIGSHGDHALVKKKLARFLREHCNEC